MILGVLACLIAAVEIDLTGSWTLAGTSEQGEPVSCPMAVPGDTHDALFAAGVIPDPFWGCNETNIQWVGRHEWRVSRTFEVPSEFLDRKEVVLRVEDCDTFCTLSVNGREVGRTENRFGRFTFDAKPFLRVGRNEIVGLFESAERIGNERRGKSGREYRMQNVTWAKNQAFVRKPACHAGWDWGPAQMLMGFCGTVKLIASDGPRVDYVYTRQDFNADLSHCTLTVYADRSDGTTVTNVVEIDNPPLWWPNGAGEQRFYEYSIDEDGVVGRMVPRTPQTRRIGLRKIEIDRSDDRLAVKVNGRELFMKGANWVPCDAFTRRQTPARLRELLGSAAAANMNMIRLWGGGQFEQEAFYDLCDEMGLLVWHDLMFACACYPADEAFLRSVDGEISHQLRRLRDHASIALWCGDNECLGFVRLPKGCESERGQRLLKEWTVRNLRIAEQVAKADPTRLYWPSSPCNGVNDDGFGEADETRGDEHCWGVWFDREPFESHYAHHPRFCSEFGVQSFPSPEVAETFASRAGIACRGPDFAWHQKNKDGNELIREKLRQCFGTPKDADAELLLSQFQQGQAVKMAAEGWRAQRPHCMGTLYWQLNDNWPVASWSSIEYGGKWKPLHYMARRFYAPVAVVTSPDVLGGKTDLTRGRVFALNDTAETVKGELTVEYWTYDGRIVSAETKSVTLAPDSSTEVSAFVQPQPSTSTFLVLTLKTRFGTVRNDWHFDVFRNLPNVRARVSSSAVPQADGSWRVSLAADVPAFFVWADVRGVKGAFDDNSLTLLPGRPRTLTFRPTDPVEAARRFRDGFSVTHVQELQAFPKDVESNLSFLSDVSRANVLAARFPMDDGTTACPPQAKRGYQQFFLRDYAYVLEGCADVLPEKDLLDAARLFLKAVSPEGAGCDFVDKSGWYNYHPGGGSIGKNPVIDGTPFTVAVEYLTWRQTQAAELLASAVLDKLAWAMEKGVPRNPKTGLVHIAPQAGEVTLATKLDRAPYGFTDVVRKQGDVLFGSLLYVEAARRLAEMFDAARRPAEAVKWRATADVVADGVNRTLWDEKAGLYLAASHTCRQPDVWGSAFAVWLGVADGTRARRISQTLVRHYDGIVQNGQIRHLLPGDYWQLADAPRDTYQNGGYWGTASGWVASAIAVTDLPLARRMLSDLVRFYREKGVPEWSIDGVGKGHLELEGYLASTTVPLSVFRRMDWGNAAARTNCQVIANGREVEVIETPVPENRLPPSDRHAYRSAAFAAEGPTSVSVCLDGKTSELTLVPGEVRVLEPKGRHGALILVASRVEPDPPKRGEPGVRYFGPGFHRADRIELKDGETLYLAPGAWVEGRVTGRGKNMRICGAGVLSGAFRPWQNADTVSGCDTWINLSGENITVSDVTLFSSWAWTLVLDGVTNAVVDNVKILGGRVINDDGMDICRSRDVFIRNCFVRTQDDCLAAKWWCENLVVSNCTLWTDSANAVRIGYECAGPDRAFSNLLFKDNEIRHLSIPKTAVDEYWANAAITVQASKDQPFENIVFDGLRLLTSEPGDHLLVAKTLPITEGSAEMTSGRPGFIRGLTLRGLSLPECARSPDILLSAHDDAHPIDGVSVESVVNLGDVRTKGRVMRTAPTRNGLFRKQHMQKAKE